MTTLFYPNVGFDRGLCGAPLLPRIARMEAHFAPLLCGAFPPEMSLYSSFKVAEEFYSYLQQEGFSPARLTSQAEPYSHGGAWGVDTEALHFFEKNGLSAHLPHYKIAKEINSRIFQNEINRLTGSGVPNSTIIKSHEMLDEFLRTLSGSAALKPLYGSTGSGFICNDDTHTLQKEGAILLQKEGALLAEPWCEKTADVATLADISPSGEVTIQGHHRNICNRFGGFYANLMAPSDPLIEPYREALTLLVIQACQIIYKKGYFGRVGFDSFLYTLPSGEPTLAALIDINARHTIASLSYGFYKKRGADSPSLLRFMARRKIILPSTYGELQMQLSDLCRSIHERISLISPLEIFENGKKDHPLRAGFFLQAETIEALFALDERLRVTLLKP